MCYLGSYFYREQSLLINLLVTWWFCLYRKSRKVFGSIDYFLKRVCSLSCSRGDFFSFKWDFIMDLLITYIFEYFYYHYIFYYHVNSLMSGFCLILRNTVLLNFDSFDSFLNILTWQDVPGSSSAFSGLSVESSISLRSPGFFEQKMVCFKALV